MFDVDTVGLWFVRESTTTVVQLTRPASVVQLGANFYDS